jgi:hypothetical protein
MKVRATVILAAAVLPLFASNTQAQSLAISIGVRETGSTAAIGADGTATGTIEWINLDNQYLVPDGTWQTFTWNFGTDPVVGFTGDGNLSTANNRGVLENLRIMNKGQIGDEIAIWIDDIVNTAGGTPTTISDFDSATVGASVVFRRAGLSGSTSANVVPNDTVGVSTEQFSSGAQSLKLKFQFTDNLASRWARVTTGTATGAQQINPTIDFTSGNSLSMKLRMEIVEPAIRWGNSGGGSWQDTANWNNGSIATGSLQIANFLSAISSNSTITIDAPVSVAGLRFKNSNNITLDGSSTITLQAPNGSADTISVEAGNVVINAPVVQADRGLTLSVIQAASTLSVNQPIVQAKINATNGLTPPLTITKVGAGKAILRSINASTVTVNDAGTLQIANNSGSSKITAVSMTTTGTPAVPTGRLDIGNNTVVIDVTDPITTPLATLTSRVSIAYAAGAWTGTGVTSNAALAAASSDTRTGIAIATATDLGVFDGTYDGQTIVSDGVILKYAIVGDSDLDGKVNTLDFNLLAGNFGGTTDIRWMKGDFDYDADVDSVDFNALAANYGKVLPASSPSLGAVVPEPTSLALALLPMVGLRRRCH